MHPLPDGWNELRIPDMSLYNLPAESAMALSQYVHDLPVEWYKDTDCFTRVIQGPSAIVNIIELVFRSLELVDPIELPERTFTCIMWDRELNHWIEVRNELSHIVRAIYTPDLPELCNYESRSGIHPWEWPNYRSHHYELVWRYGGLGVYYSSGF